MRLNTVTKNNDDEAERQSKRNSTPKARAGVQKSGINQREHLLVVWDQRLKA